MKVNVILPVLKNEYFERITDEEFKATAQPDTEITVVSLDKGPASIESMYDDSIASPLVLEKVKEAEESGFDAVIIDCFADPALHAARELVNIPVIGPCQSSLAFASIVGENISIITVLRSVVPILERLARVYGFTGNLVSVRSIEIPVLKLNNKKIVKSALLKECKEAIKFDGADTIILGCTGMIGMAGDLQKELKIPVIDAATASLKMAESLYDLKISHSKEAYPVPPTKLRKF